MNKTAIKNFAIWARNKLIKEITYKAGLVGVTEKGIADALPQSTKDMQWFDIGTSEPSSIQGEAIKQREKLVQRIREKEKDSDYKTAYTSIIEEVAYTWFNRLIAIRFMEVNDYLPSRVRVLSSETSGKEEPDLVTSPYDTDLEFTNAEQDLIMQYKDHNQLDELFRMLFIKQCNKLNEVLPELFEKTADYTELLLNISYTDKDGVVYHLTHDIDTEDFCVREDEEGQVTGQIEIIGWLYQYYNTELKDEAFALLKKNVKVTKERIPAVTQLFTPEWIVKYMVENSLGRLWVEGHPDEELKKNWKYYLEEAEQEDNVKKQLEVIREEYKQLKPEDIKVIDPCMGSGHILVYAFEVLIQIYEANGYSQRDAAKSILENNIYGLDIDNRAYQLGYFSLMMKARQYNRRILMSEIRPRVYAIVSSNFMTNEIIDFIAGNEEDIKKDVLSICSDLRDAEEYGSIINVNKIDFNKLYDRLQEIENTFYDDIFSQYNKVIVVKKFIPLIKQVEIMSAKYNVVITNPPYMGNSSMGNKLTTFMKKNYPKSKMDLFAAFIQKGNKMVKEKGFNCMVTMQSWMFLASFEEMRKEILSNKSINNLMHMENMVMGIAFGTVVSNMRNIKLDKFKGIYHHIKFEDIVEEKPKKFPPQNSRFIVTSSEQFSKIPGNPIAYWMSPTFVESFKSPKILDISESKAGIVSGDDTLFLKYWYEISYKDITFDAKSFVDKTAYKWVPINKGGSFRKYYGNYEHVINIFDIWNSNKTNISVRRSEPDYYFRPAITWSYVTSGDASFRITENKTSATASPNLFFRSNEELKYVLGFLNSKISQVYLDLLNPTVNLNVTNVSSLPICIDKLYEQEVCQYVEENIEITKIDWDSYETSWDFKTSPLISKSVNTNLGSDKKRIEEIYKLWNQHLHLQRETFRYNQTKLNEIFIDLYKFQKELTVEVSDKDITVRVPNLHEDIKNMISYVIGCIFGRYSLDIEGIIYAGGEWKRSKYTSFIPKEDNIILITEDEYFADDIVNRFVEFVKVVYGEETLEENLDFIAKALGNKGNTSREMIRNYFIKDFYKDHCKTYQKRPIYWQFDSGKQNGFKALIYMHRYNADTIGNLRIDYLHRLQKVYESEITRMQDIVDNSNNAKESTAAAKRRDKLVKQLQETKDYDQKIAHLALARTEIDLDDGVKVNYEKVQTGTDGKKLEVLAKI